MRELWVRLRAAFADLALREQVLVGLAVGLLTLTVLYFALVAPLSAAGFRGRQQAETAKMQLAEMGRLRHDLDGIQGRLAAVEERIESGPRGNIFTTLESLASASAVEDKVHSMERRQATSSERYRETRVEVDLRGITLAQLVAYLERIESAPQPLSVKGLHLKTRTEQTDLLDATFSVSSFEPL